MKTLKIAAFAVGFGLTVGTAQAECPGVAEDRLVDLLGTLALIGEQVDVSMDEPIEAFSQNVGLLREAALVRDEQALEAACMLMTRYPSLEPALEETAQRLADPKMVRWLAETQLIKGASRDPALTLNCLTTGEFVGLRTTVFTLRIALFALQAVCDGLQCYPTRVCQPFCFIARPVLGVIIPIFESGLAVDALNCSTRHSKEMELWCEDELGACGTGRRSTSTLAETEQLLRAAVVPQIQSLSEDVATTTTLQSTRDLLADRFERTEQQIEGLGEILQDDIAGQSEFTDQTQRLDIEVQLAGSQTGVPVQFLLPVAAGGRLEEVRETVADAIVRTTAAGLDINDAILFLRQGDAALNVDDYAQAFSAYRQAYQEVVR